MAFEVPANFRVLPASDFCLRVADGTHDSPKPVDQGKKLVTSKNLKESRIELGNTYLISDEDFEQINRRSKVDQWDIIFSMIGTVGELALVTHSNPNFAIKNVGLFKNRDELSAKWLFYYMHSPVAREELGRRKKGSTQQYVSLGDLRSFPVVVPIDKSIMPGIVGVLSALDYKIDLLRETNRTLETIAQSLFKSWFVDFDPVRAKAEGREPDGVPPEVANLFPSEFEESIIGPVPKGWRVAPLDSIADFLNGLAMQKFPVVDESDWLPVIKIAQLRKGDTEGADRASLRVPPDYVVQDGDVLFSWSGSLEVDIWCGGRGGLNQHLFKVTSKRYPKWFYYLWTKVHLPSFRQIAAHKATTMGHIQRCHLTDAKVITPPDGLLSALSEIIAPLIQQAWERKLEVRTLTSVRDTLLPRLMSGKLRISDTQDISA